METVLPGISSAQVAYDQGFTYFHSNRYSEAALEFERAIVLDPNYKKAYYGLALAQFHMNNFGEAEKEVEAALRIDPHYKCARELLDAIKSVVPPPVPPPSPPDPVEPTFLERVLNLWQYIAPNLWLCITGALAFVLLICLVVFATQSRKKDEYISRIEILENQQIETNSKFIAASNEKRRLSFENRRLGNQLTEKDKEVKNQSSTVQQLQSEKDKLRSQNRKLENEKRRLSFENRRLGNQLTEKDEEIKNQSSTVQRLRSEKDKLRSQNQRLDSENATLRNQLESDGPISSIQTLLTENKQLLHENQRLQNQLTSQDKEIKNKTTIAEQLRNEKEELLSQKRELQNENETLLEQLVKRGPSPDDSDQFRAELLQKIDHGLRRVDSAARSKNNQGLFQWDYNKAIEFFQDARKIDSQSAIIYYNLGSAYLAMKKYTKSKNHLQKALTLDPRFKEAYYNLALAYLGDGDRQEAKRKAQKSLSIDESYRSARQLLAAIE